MSRFKAAFRAALATVLVTAIPAGALAADARAKPNVIVILADDLGYGDLGVQGGRDVATPRIDRLAAEGVRLTDFYANHPVCSPSRAGLLAGRYQHRFGFENNPGAAQRTSPDFGLSAAPTLPERLKARGYATAMFGKWHIGYTEGNVPTARGFDTFYGFLDGAMAYTPDGATGLKTLMRGTATAPMPAHTTEAFASEAATFITQNRDRPFFIYASFNAVHAPLQSTSPYLARFPSVADPNRRAYLAMLAALDDAVGTIVDAVDRNGLGKDTLIVFTSDNGGPTWQTTSANGPLNGVKALTLEGGIRVPGVFRWTGTLPAGRVLDTVAIGHDVAATAVALSGAPVGPDLDGVDLTPYLKGQKTGDAHGQLFWRSNHQGAMREGPWKLVKAEDAHYLFDLRTDIGERHDLSARNPKRLAEMKAAWQGWSDSMMAPKWGSLNRSGSAPGGEIRGLVDRYVKGLPTDPRALLYGGGPE